MIRSKILVKDFLMLKDNKYNKIELAGICLRDNKKTFTFLDYTGEIEIYKKLDLEIPSKRCILSCSVFYKNKLLSLFCTGYKLVDIYETIFFTMESITLKNQNY